MSDQLLIAPGRGLSPSELSRRAAASFVSWVLSIPRWSEVSRVRRHLAQLDDHMLEDIGLTRAEVRAEVEKWPWQ